MPQGRDRLGSCRAARTVDLMFRRLTAQQLTIDIVVAALCVLLRFTFTLDNLAVTVVVLGMAAALAIRRLSPALSLAVAWVFAIVQMLASLPPDFSNLAILAVLYSTARYGGAVTKWAGLASAGVGAVVSAAYLMLVSGWFGTGAVEAPRVILVSTFALGASLAALGLSWTLGLLIKTWRAAAESRRDRLAAEQRMIVEQERNRIARDMHDVVAHSLAVVIAQADGARYAAKADPGAVDDALTTISSTAREALADVRLLLGQLRHNQEEGPQPALADLDRLVDQLRASGLVIALERTGEPLALPTAQQLAIYRIVQEALTNALRHGDIEREVEVTLAWSTDAADVTVSSALRDPANVAGPIGHGIAGMRERALLVGGTVAARPEGDRFVVRASIPTRSAVPA